MNCYLDDSKPKYLTKKLSVRIITNSRDASASKKIRNVQTKAMTITNLTPFAEIHLKALLNNDEDDDDDDDDDEQQ